MWFTRTGDGGFGLNLARISLIFNWYAFCSTVTCFFAGSYNMIAFLRSSSRCSRSRAHAFVSANVILWKIGQASCVKCLSSRPPKWPLESHPSIEHLRSSGTAGVFFTGLNVLFFVFVLLFLDLPLDAGARFTGLFDMERLLSDSDSDSDALPGLNIARKTERIKFQDMTCNSEQIPVKCLDFLVLEDRVNFRTTFWVGLFSISDSELALSFDSDDLLAWDDFCVFFLFAVFLLGGVESALDSVSESLFKKNVEWINRFWKFAYEIYLVVVASVDVVLADDSAELFDIFFSTGFGFVGGRPFGRIGGFVLPPVAVVLVVFTGFDAFLCSSSDSVVLSDEKILFFLESAANLAIAKKYLGINYIAERSNCVKLRTHM